MTDTVTIGSRTYTGHIITPFIYRNNRASILIDDGDFAAFDAAGHGGDGTIVTDLVTDSTFLIRRADCGLGCKCAAEIVR